MFRKTFITLLILCMTTPVSWVDALARDCGMLSSETVMADAEMACCAVECMGNQPAPADRISHATILTSDSMQCCTIAAPREMVVMAPALPTDGKRSAPVLATPCIERSASLTAQTFVPVNNAPPSAFPSKLYQLHATYLI